MKVSIIVGGKFHSFVLEKEINKKKYLNSIVSSYPKFLVNKYNIENDKINTIVLKEVALKIINRFPLLKKKIDSDYLLSNYFSKKAANLINYLNIDLIIGWSSFSREAFLKAKDYKCIKILERGSTHIQFQKEILKKEYLELNLEPIIPSENTKRKELEEYNLADYISLPSDFVKNTFIKNYIDEKKIIKIPYGVNLNEFNLDKSRQNVKKKFRIISVGTVSIRKGSHYLIKAFTELNLKNAELIFVGSIEYDFKKLLENFTNLKNVKFVKKQKQADLKNYYNQADIFVQCSLEEGLAVVQAQAMACGLPVICTENTGGSEIIDDGVNGFIIPIKDVNILKDKILIFYNNEDKLKKMSFLAHQKAQKDLSWENYGKKISNIYLNLLNH